MVSPFIVNLEDDLIAKLRPYENRIGRILELGLVNLSMEEATQFEGAVCILEFLAGLPSPDEVVAFTPPPQLGERVAVLLDKNREDGLSESEQQEWAGYQLLEHLVRLAKIKAASQLAQG